MRDFPEPYSSDQDQPRGRNLSGNERLITPPAMQEAPRFVKHEPESQDSSRGIRYGQIAFVVLLLIALGIYARPDSVPIDGDTTNLRAETLDALSPRALGLGRVKIFLNNSLLGPSLRCDEVFPVEREIADPSPRGALETLLAGPTETERREGYFTSLSPGIPLRSADIDGEEARADFGTHLAYNVSPGSCREKALRAQIEGTLKQFTGVRRVVITLEQASY